MKKILKTTAAIAGIGMVGAGSAFALTSCGDKDNIPNIKAEIRVDSLEKRVLNISQTHINKPGFLILSYIITSSDNKTIDKNKLFVHVYKVGTSSGLPSTSIIGEISSIGNELKVNVKIGSNVLTSLDAGEYAILISSVGYTPYIDPDTIRVMVAK